MNDHARLAHLHRRHARNATVMGDRKMAQVHRSMSEYHQMEALKQIPPLSSSTQDPTIRKSINREL